MIADKLDYNKDKMEIVQLSNDAYHYLAFKEPCLDEDNMDEVKEFKEQFSYGFKIEPDIELVEDSDLVPWPFPIGFGRGFDTQFQISKKTMRTRPLKKLLKEQGFTEVSSLEEYEKSTKKFPKKKVWFRDTLCKYWCVNTANGNYFGFDGDFSGYTIGKFVVDLDSEKSAIRLFLCDLFGKVVGDELNLVSEVKDKEQFDKWYNAIAA